MRTELDAAYDDDFDAFVSDADLIGFFHPREVVSDPILTLPRKRQLLAYWASDIHAVPNFPALRSINFGPTVSIDEIKSALSALDDMVDLPAIAASQSQASMR